MKHHPTGAAAAAAAFLLLGFGCAPDSSNQGAAQLYGEGELSFGNEFALTFSPDGSTAYVTRRVVGAGDERKVDLYAARRRNGGWSDLERLGISSDYRDADQFISPDGSRLYFMSERPLPGTSEKHDYDLWVSEKGAQGWLPPTHMGPTVNSSPAWEGFPVVSADGTLFFFSEREGGLGQSDIYMSELEGGVYQAPTNLGALINSSAWDGLAYVTPDKSLMIFYSDRPGGYGGGDLYASRFRDGIWSTPENLGPKVNTGSEELFPHIGPDGDYLYFTRYAANGDRLIYRIALAHLNITID